MSKERLTTRVFRGAVRVAAAAGLVAITGCVPKELITPTSETPTPIVSPISPTEIPPSPTLVFGIPIPTETPAPIPTPIPQPTPTKEATPTPEVKFIELRNCTTNAPEALEAGVKWAIETAAGEQGRDLPVNGGRETFRLTKQTKVIIEVVPPGSPRAYLLFSNLNQFGYYKEGDRLLIVVEGGASPALYRALLGLQLDPIYLLANPDNPQGSQIPMGTWDTIDRQPLIDLWKPVIDDILLSPDSCGIGTTNPCPTPPGSPPP